MKLGILGGTFNPIHIGHLILAQDAMETFEIDHVLFVVCARSPHKQTGLLASDEHRAAMVELALSGNPNFEFCDLELRRGGTSYTVDTIRELKKARPNDQFNFIIGSDTLQDLHTWKEIGELLGVCRFLTAVRPGFDPKQFSRQQPGMTLEQTDELLANIFNVHQVEISSSEIRYRVAEGMSLKYLTLNSVETYIAEHRLYAK